jgi:hypothetical protein
MYIYTYIYTYILHICKHIKIETPQVQRSRRRWEGSSGARSRPRESARAHPENSTLVENVKMLTM